MQKNGEGWGEERGWGREGGGGKEEEVESSWKDSGRGSAMGWEEQEGGRKSLRGLIKAWPSAKSADTKHSTH